MTAVLRIGWVMLVGLAIADTLKYAATEHPIRAFLLIGVVALLIALRRDLTQQP